MNKLEVGASDISNSQRFQNWFHTKLKGIFLGKIKENVQSILIKLWKTFSTGDLKLLFILKQSESQSETNDLGFHVQFINPFYARSGS